MSYNEIDKESLKKYCDFLKESYIKYQNSPDTRILQEARSAKSIKGPFHVSWEITSTCNFLCKHCRAANNRSTKKKNFFSLDQYLNVIDDLANMQIYTLGITGGEPFTHEYILDIIEYSKKKIYN